MRLKNFTEFLSESDWFDNHPDHPANQEDGPEPQRDIDFKPSQVKFDLLGTDYTSYAILQDKETKFYYAAYLEGDEINEYQLYTEIDGDKNWEDIDDDAILFMATDLTTLRGAKAGAFLGEGIEGWEDGKVIVLIDEPLRAYFEEDFKKSLGKYWNPLTKKGFETLLKVLEEIKEPLHKMRGRLKGKKYGF